MMIKAVLIAGLGSFIGGTLRYVISLLMQNKLQAFPWNSFLVNLAGCFLIGLLFSYAEKSGMHPAVKLFLGTGMLGGFTTFSAFSIETLRLVQINAHTSAVLYVLSSVILGLVLTYVGFLLGSRF